MFFSYTLAYATVSIKFDFVSIWLSMDEYIIFSKKNTVTDHSHKLRYFEGSESFSFILSLLVKIHFKK